MESIPTLPRQLESGCWPSELGLRPALVQFDPVLWLDLVVFVWVHWYIWVALNVAFVSVLALEPDALGGHESPVAEGAGVRHALVDAVLFCLCFCKSWLVMFKLPHLLVLV